jgi:hypothetical protein
MTDAARLVILYGVGGLSDCGRHAVQAALEQKVGIGSITVLTQHPELLNDSNWKCGCPEPHAFTEEEKKRFTVVHINKGWEDAAKDDSFLSHFQNATAVISCLGNRQPTFMDVSPDTWCAEAGNKMVITAMKKHNIKRVVAISSIGVNDDWPSMEFHWAGKIMDCIFMCCARKAYRDLCNMEDNYRASGLDYLFIRPVGIGEDVLPVNQWHIQTEKYKDRNLVSNMAKLDVARYMVQEALQPTRHKDAVVIGGVMPVGSKEKK